MASMPEIKETVLTPLSWLASGKGLQVLSALKGNDCQQLWSMRTGRGLTVGNDH